MAMPPQKFREIVFQLLYSCDLSGGCGDEVVALLMKELAVSKRSVLQAKELVDEILRLQPDIDALIGGMSRSYDFSRIQSVERNILRLGVYELMFAPHPPPPKVAIAEAMRLSRKFTTPEAASFVNAILDALYKQREGEALDLGKIQEVEAALAESDRRAELELEVEQKVDDESDTE